MSGPGWRWLGVAGVELRAGDDVLLVDPYFTRFPLWRMFAGRVRPRRDLIAQHAPRCDHLLVTHPHFDHLMDAPDVARNTGATVYGSANTCQLLDALGVPAAQVRQIRVGERLALGPFAAEVLASQHGKTPLDRQLNGPLKPDLRPPLRAFDYRMDEDFGFLVAVDGLRVLVGPGENPHNAPPADLLFVLPILTSTTWRPYFESLLARVRPRVVVPYHWDDFFRPLDKPVRPFFGPSLRRLDLEALRGVIEGVAPGVRVVVPEMFKMYEMGGNA